MGYYSSFEISTEPPICNVTLSEPYEIVTDDSGFALSDDVIKWYDYRSNMLTVSKLHPQSLLIVDRVGEESPDIERSFFKDGKCYSEKLEYTPPDFDPSRMK